VRGIGLSSIVLNDNIELVKEIFSAFLGTV
jgi:hypothetical protein